MALRKAQGKQQKGESFEQNAQEESKMKEQQKEEQRLQLQQAIEESRRLLIQNKAAEAADRCFFALQKALNSKVFGENSIELMDGYFVLADSYLELGRIKKAEEFMVAAYWNLLKHSSTEKQKTIDQQQGDVSQVNPELLQKLQSTLHKSFGRLFTAQQDYKKAKSQLANCIYLESQEYGPEHIALSRAYYLLANVFTLEKKFDQSMAIFQKIKQI